MTWPDLKAGIKRNILAVLVVAAIMLLIFLTGGRR